MDNVKRALVFNAFFTSVLTKKVNCQLTSTVTSKDNDLHGGKNRLEIT